MAAAVAAALAPEGALLIAREDCLRDFGLEPAADYKEVTRVRIGRHRFIILESPR